MLNLEKICENLPIRPPNLRNTEPKILWLLYGGILLWNPFHATPTHTEPVF